MAVDFNAVQAQYDARADQRMLQQMVTGDKQEERVANSSMLASFQTALTAIARNLGPK